MNDLQRPEYWDAAYAEERDNWDMGTPTPVFVDLLTRMGMNFQPLGDRDYSALGCTPRVLLPCSGRGYDALLFAGYGWEVTAVDFAEHPLRWLRTEAAHAGLPVEILQEDMFTLSRSHPQQFDLLVEYTCVCAIDPVRHAEFVALACEVLRPGGTVMALLFPVDGRPGGPPFSIDVEDFKRQMAPYFDLRHESTPSTSVKPRRGRERLLLWTRRGS
ncbi:MAG: methyltransferase domain-containing protein [Bacteroidetes bacterium]|nr:methyltransferase domain-containing protein [Bacteroidota bacterium]